MNGSTVPTYVTAVELWRVWRLSFDGELCSWVVSRAWEAGWQRATCYDEMLHDPPDLDCCCGFYACDPRLLLWQLPEARRSPWAVPGIVRLAGRYVRGEHAWRAEYACVAALVAPENAHPDARRALDVAAERYDVPLLDASAFVEARVMPRARLVCRRSDVLAWRDDVDLEWHETPVDKPTPYEWSKSSDHGTIVEFEGNVEIRYSGNVHADRWRVVAFVAGNETSAARLRDRSEMIPVVLPGQIELTL